LQVEDIAAGLVDRPGHHDLQDVVVPVQVGAFAEQPPVLGLRQARIAQLVRGIERFASGYSHSHRAGHASRPPNSSPTIAASRRLSVSATITMMATSNVPSA